MTFDGGSNYDSGFSYDAVQTDPVPFLQPAPTVSNTTQRLYAGLPEMYRAADVVTGGAQPYPLLRWLSLLGDQLDNVETLLDRFQYVPLFLGGPAGDTSDLVNPLTANPAWLPWIAQIYGVVLGPGLTVAQQRNAIAGAAAQRYAGSRQSIVAVARSVLTGSQFVQLVDHVGGSQWQMDIITKPSESPLPDTLVALIVASGVKPAGVILTHLYYEASWATIQTNLPTWAAWETAPSADPTYQAGTWAAIEQQQATSNTASWTTIGTVYPTWSGWASAGSWAGVEAA